ELIATPDRLILISPLKLYELPAENVERIEKAGLYIYFLIGLIFGSIRIYHTIEGYPELLMFTAWRVKADKLLEELKDLGYKIK
ncbi:MAG: hypothetical protein ACYTE3_29170, partial [Planctomycetota bacterium]